MRRVNKSKSKKTIIASVSVFMFLVLICIAACIIFKYWTTNSDIANPNIGIFYIEETDRTYQYEIEMFGTLPNAAAPICFYVYTDDADLTFSEVSEALTSSQSISSCDFYISEAPIERVN